MKDDKLRLFTNGTEIKSFSAVDGYDEGLTNATIARWKSLATEPVAVFKATSKKLTRTMESDAIESKDETDLTE